jgi:DNA invertase Pin-like site-specific DNA recombinase
MELETFIVALVAALLAVPPCVLAILQLRDRRRTPNACARSTTLGLSPDEHWRSWHLAMNALPALDPSLAVVYRRVSSAEQEKASGPERQAAAVRRFASAHGLTIAADHFEDRSGTLPMEQRPALRAALESALEHGAGVLLVEEPGRLARDEYAADALRTFAAAGVRVLYADGRNAAAHADDPAAKLSDGISHLLAAYDRRVIVARMAAGREAKAKRAPRSRAQGGRLPLGYRRTRAGAVEVNPAAAAEVHRVFGLIRAGQSVRKVAQTMTDETGRPWMPTTVARIVGRKEYKRAGEWRIIHPKVWNAAQTALASRRRRQPA